MQQCADVLSHLVAVGQADMVRMATLDTVATDHTLAAAWAGRVGQEHNPCHDPSHGGSYMAEGAFYIRIGLPPRFVLGDCLASSRLWTDFS